METQDSNPRLAGTLRFGPFELETETGELRRDGGRVRLRYQPSRVLVLLASRPGRLVTREEIRAAVWGAATHVDYEQGLNYCIRDIRSALGDMSGQPRFVETLPRRGYRFVADVEPVAVAEPPEAARLGARRRPGFARAAAGLVAAAALALGVWFIVGKRDRDRGTLRAPLTLAVLPLEDLSGERSQASFADGLAEELTAQLGRLHPGRLAVIGRSTARGFRQRARPIEALGRELGVDYALEGSIRQSSGRLRFIARLVRVADRKQVWTETFEAELKDFMELQRGMAQAAASGVHLTLDPGEPARASGPPRVQPEAFRLYARGRALWNTWTVPALRRSVECFATAVQVAPDYALAHAGLADAYIALADQSSEPYDELLRLAKQEALRAIELQDSLAEGHAALGMVKASHEFDWAGAERELQRAIALNPRYATGRHWYAHVLRANGRRDEALMQIQLAAELAPFSAIISHGVGMVRLQRGELLDAVNRFRAVIASDPGFPPAHMGLGRALALQGDVPGALRSLERAVELSGGNARYEAALVHAYAATGRIPAARTILARLERESIVPAYDLAIARVGLSDRDGAVRFLERAILAKNPAARNVLVDERLRPLHRHERWGALTRQAGLSLRGAPAPLRLQ